MLRILGAVLVLTILTSSFPTAAGAEPILPTDTCDPDGQQSSGAIYRICMPEQGKWNGDLVIYAHGYVAFNEPVAIPEDQLEVDGVSIPGIINQLGYAFATTSYRTNGLAILQGIDDIRELVRIFSAAHGEPRHVYLGGASEGGIVTALAIERFPTLFDGGLAACGPVGNFRHQINYWGDFRAVFDYFFPDVIPGSAIDIPQQVIEHWDEIYAPEVQKAIQENPEATDQLLRVTHASIDPEDPATVEKTILDLLWYNVFATNDGIARLGGQPFDNTRRRYRGSDDDRRLNRGVQRYQGDARALSQIEAHYQTTGALQIPLVTLHTTGDPIIPYWHELLYRGKVLRNDSQSLHTNILVRRYGHCNFKISEVLVAFAVLVRNVSGENPAGIESALPDENSRQAYLRLARTYGILR